MALAPPSTAASIYDQFNRVAEKVSDKTALIYLGRRFTFSQLKDLVESLAASLSKLGVRRGDRAIIYLAHTPQWVIAWLSLLRIGAIAVPIAPVYTSRDLIYIANNSGAETIFCTDTNFEYVVDALPKTNLKRVIVTTMVDLLPWWKRAIGRAFDKVPSGKYRSGGNVFTFKSLLKRSASPPPPPPTIERRSTAEILYTGGTTGYPKGVPILHAMFLQSITAQRKNSEPLIPIGEDVVIQGAALYHILGQAVGLGGLLHGETVVLLPRMNLDGLLDHIQRYKVTTLVGVPALYRRILEHDRLDQYDLSSLKYCFSGGDTLPIEVARRWLRKVGVPIYQGYGATETCGGVTLTPAGSSFPEGTVGKVVDHQIVKLVDPDTLEPIPPGEAGELLVSSENMVTEYWNRPEETEKAFVMLDGRLWYRTGDMMRVDKDGWWFFVDRTVDIIKHKGYRVSASKIETVLQEHPAVMASCVVGVPDPDVGERIKAFVVLKEDVKGVSSYELIAWCRERLAPYEVPQYVEIRDMLPKSKVGKLLRRELRDEERRKVGKK